MTHDNASVELRVLTGRHRGGRTALPDTAEPVSLGTDTGAQIVLSDLPVETAQVHTHADSWQWTDARGRSAQLGLGDGLDVDGLVLQVCTANEPWLQASDLASRQRCQRLDKPTQAPDAATDESTFARPDPLAQTRDLDVASTGPRPAPARKQQRNSRRWLVPSLVALGAGAASVGWVITHDRSTEAAPAVNAARTVASAAPASMAPPPPGPEAARTLTDAALAVIERMGWSGRVDAFINPAGRLQLRGVLDNDDQIEGLVREVRKISARLTLQVVTQGDFEADIRGLANDMPKGVVLEPLPQGVVLVRGTVPDQEAATALTTQINSMASQPLRIDTSALRIASEAAPERRDAVAAAVKQVKLPEVSLVMGGPDPFIVLKSGQRVFPGGTIGKLRLIAVTDQHLEFDAGDGQVLRSPR